VHPMFLLAPAPLVHRGRYPAHYPWLLALATLDITLTTLVLSLGGSELNPVANLVIMRTGIPGMAALKAAAILLVVAICERLWRSHPDLGRRIATLGIAANTVPVAVGSVYIAEYTAGLLGA
jgi:hypothetical protein